MNVTTFRCGAPANESELKAFEYLRSCLRSEPGDEQWVLLANLTFSVTHQLQSDEIDLIVIGPPGVQVIEVKHWTPQWCDAHKLEVEKEADRLTMKARKVAGKLRRVLPNLPHVPGSILLTQDRAKVKGFTGEKVRGVWLHHLNAWRKATKIGDKPVLSRIEVNRAASVLEPRSPVAIDGSIRRLAGYINLELQTPRDQRFRRVYRGIHPSRRDHVVLHLYDFSASDAANNARVTARREFEALRRTQIHPWAPRIFDSFQDAPGYENEMSFFTFVDPAAPCIEDRAKDDKWVANSRLLFARNCVQSLMQLHSTAEGEESITHRNLNPRTILVKHDNSPILTGFHYAKIPSEISVGSNTLSSDTHWDSIAPEVRSGGLAAADQRSDIYSLCACLLRVINQHENDLNQPAAEVLSRGLAERPADRSTLQDLDDALSVILGEPAPAPEPPAARFWTEEQIVRFKDDDYRIVSRLGSGGVGTTFKVVQIDPQTQEDLGTYVAKVVQDEETGVRVLKSYRLVRDHLASHTALSTIFEVGSEWMENGFTALMQWISGTPLHDLSGVFPLFVEQQQERDSEVLALRWLRDICEALDVLHSNGLVHGDVSPKNLIVSGSDLILTDYDLVGKIGEPTTSPGTIEYCSPSKLPGRPASASDDIYALAASFFRVVFERPPFRYEGSVDKDRGLNWEGVNRDEYSELATFLDKATHQHAQSRFASAQEALADLEAHSTTATVTESEEVRSDRTGRTLDEVGAHQPLPAVELREQRVEWLRDILQSYPGSIWGNRETRGLDTTFAQQTYVGTGLEKTLYNDIVGRRARLVILCGNAGDGKTALLQHLMIELGMREPRSSQRVLEWQVTDGPFVRVNLDGAASWDGRSADEILDEFLAPFKDGPPDQDIVHMLAINDGRLIEWIEGYEHRNEGLETELTKELYSLVEEESSEPHRSHIRFVNLNQRSLVGGISPDRKRIDTSFVESLVDELYGGEQAAEIWAPCLSCKAKPHCEVFRASNVFGPKALLEARGTRPRSDSVARQRLLEALQSVHLRGETHITVRDLRAALVYILFGVHFCDDYHAENAPGVLSYWDRAFSPDSPDRQGEVLNDLALFDPALEAHPKIDRLLTSKIGIETDPVTPRYPDLGLASARRRAYFEWTLEQVERIAGNRNAFGLARGAHIRDFRDLPLESEAHKLSKICKELCSGIANLETLPPQAHDRHDIVPLRVIPRTPTETAFWIEKPLASFRLEVDPTPAPEGVERLHRHAWLIYRYRDGNEERLRLGAELFHFLRELAAGYQLGDASTDDTFANLSIFVQRLVREDERRFIAWNPMADESVYEVSAEMREVDSHPQQSIVITPRSRRNEP